MTYSIDIESLTIELILSKGRNWPDWSSTQNYTIVDSKELSDSKKSIKVCFPIAQDCQSLTIENNGKQANDTVLENGVIVRDQSIAVVNMWANNIFIELENLNLFFNFYPRYLEGNLQYAKENNIVLESQMHTTEMYFNGQWTFNFSRPFFVWYHHLLMEQLSKFNNWVQSSHLGFASDEQLLRLGNVLKELS